MATEPQPDVAPAPRQAHGPSAAALIALGPITFALLAYGGVTPNGRVLLAPLLGIALLGLIPLRARAPLSPWPLAFPTLGLGALFSLQLLPLPPSWVEVLSPLSFEHWALLPEGSRGSAALSAVDPAGRRLLPFTLLALAFPWALYHALGRPRDRSALAAGLALTAAAGALLTALQAALGGGAIYPFLGPGLRGGGEHASGFFINPNHAGLHAALGALFAAGLALEALTRGAGSASKEGRRRSGTRRRSRSETGERRRRRRRSQVPWGALLWGALSILLATLTLLSGSQGALFVLLGGGALALFAGAQRQGQREVGVAVIAGAWGILGVVLATGVGRALRLAGEVTGSEAGALERRLEIWAGALSLIQDAPLLGSGLGAHPYLGPLVQRFRENLRYEYAHNDLLETLVEGGLVGGICVALALWLIARALRAGGWRSTPQPFLTCAALGAAAAIALHALVDFPFQIPALALMGGATLALLMASLAPPAPRAPAPPPALAAAGLLLLGAALGAAGRRSSLQAEAAIEAALALPPESGPTLPTKTPDIDAAELPLGDLHRLTPERLDTLGDAARNQARGDIDRAGGHLLRALALHRAAAVAIPSFAPAHRGEGLDRLYLGDTAAAEAALRRAVTAGAGAPANWWALARFHRFTGDNAAAFVAYGEAVQRSEGPRLLALFDEVQIFEDPGQLILPGDHEGALQLGLWYRGRGEPAKARDALILAQDARPGDPRALEALTLLALSRGDTDAAERWALALEEAGGPEGTRYRLKGDVLFAKGDTPHALAYHRKALTLESRPGDGARVLRDLLEMGRIPEARALGAELSAGPVTGDAYQEAELRRLYAQAQTEAGDSIGAAATLQAARQIDPGHGGVTLAIATALAKGGDPAEALRLIDDHLRLNPLDWRAHQGRALLLTSLGRDEEARRAWGRVLAIKPGHPPAQKALRGP